VRRSVGSGVHRVCSKVRGSGSKVRGSDSDSSSDSGSGLVSVLVSWRGSCKRVIAGSRRFEGSRCHERVADDIRGKNRGECFKFKILSFCCVCGAK
jgi:hypothetical protein